MENLTNDNVVVILLFVASIFCFMSLLDRMIGYPSKNKYLYIPYMVVIAVLFAWWYARNVIIELFRYLQSYA